MAEPRKYSVMNAFDIYNMEVEPPEEIWGGIGLSNDITEIVGSSGIGKSRIMLNLAVCQILGRPFVGLPTCPRPLTWLLLGTENNLYRYHTDLKAMLANCTDGQLQRVKEHLFMNVLTDDADSDMAMSANENAEIFRNTLAAVKPDVLVLDPWGDICSGGELDDRVIRQTITNLRQLRKGITEKLALIIVNHARMGAQENAKASGLEAGNFGKNSKALYTICRCAWNISHLDNDPSLGVIGFYNAKRSNGKPYDAFVVQFDAQHLCYVRDAAKDYEETRAAMLAETAGPVQNKTEVREANADAQLKNAFATIARETEKGPKSVDFLKLRLNGKIAARSMDSLFKPEVLQVEGLACYRTHGKDGTLMVGGPIQIAELSSRDQELERREKEAAEAAEQAEKERKEAEKAAERAKRDEEKAAEKARKEAEKAAKKAAREAEKAKTPKRKPGRPRKDEKNN